MRSPIRVCASWWEQTPGYHIDADNFVYSDKYSARHIADLRKRIDLKFHTPLHVAGVVFKLARILNWRVKAKAVVMLPIFLTLLVTSRQGGVCARGWGWR